jgi:hypothetical protein
MHPYLFRNTCFSDEVNYTFQEMAIDTTEARGTRRVLTSAVNVYINVWGGLAKNGTVRPFFFVKTTLAYDGYFDIMAQFVYPRVSDLQPKVFQQDGASPLHSSLLI